MRRDSLHLSLPRALLIAIAAVDLQFIDHGGGKKVGLHCAQFEIFPTEGARRVGCTIVLDE